MNSPDKNPHIEAQAEYFDNRADVFLQPIPEEIKKRTKSIVDSARLNAGAKVLDVGTGAGVLIEHFLDCGLDSSDIVACDLSAAMLANARKRFPEINFWQGDIVDLQIPLPAELPKDIHGFDAIFFNACFGNMWDQIEVIQSALGLLAPRGKIVISHPLGNNFVAALRKSDPDIVPHLLPSKELLLSWCDKNPLELVDFEEPGDTFYLAILARDH